jgi:hypothetical protein
VTSGGLFWRRSSSVGLHIMRRLSGPAEQLLASEQGTSLSLSL